MPKTKTDQRKAYRRFNFGRRKTDGKPSTAIMIIEPEDRGRVMSDVVHLIHTMPGARDFLEQALARAQAESFAIDKEPSIVI